MRIGEDVGNHHEFVVAVAQCHISGSEVIAHCGRRVEQVVGSEGSALVKTHVRHLGRTCERRRVNHELVEGERIRTAIHFHIHAKDGLVLCAAIHSGKTGEGRGRHILHVL